MIYIFKTSVKTSIRVKQLKPHIDTILPAEKWNFDLQDRDKILRIDSEEDVAMAVINLLKNHKFSCKELF